MRVIGIGHKARQGKNLLAEYIVMQAGKRGIYAKQYGFADALRSACRVLGMRQKNARVLQHFGTDVMRQIDDEIWIRILLDTLNDENPKLAVITDVRFKNEAKAIRNLEGRVVRLERYDSDGNRVLASDRDCNHQSEMDLQYFDFDHTIENRTITGLQASAIELLNVIL